MAWSGGTYSRVHDWAADAAGAINIEAVRMDQEDDSIALGIDTCLTKDGQNGPTTNLPMGANRHTGVGNAVAKTDYASADDVIDQNLTFYVDTGAADVYVVTPSPSLGAYAEGQRVVFRATNTNTGASTLNANALGAIAIQTNDSNALEANMIVVGGYYEVTYDVNASPDRWVLTSPHSLTEVNEGRTLTSGTGMTGGGDLSADRTFNVIGGTGITANANDIATDDAAIVHDNLSGFVANEHINHASVSVIAGTGLTGGGTITANRTINAVVASETAQGIVERATQAEVDAGSDTTRYVSPATLDAKPSVAGIFSFTFAPPDSGIALLNQSAALLFFANNNSFRTKLDLSGVTQIRMISHVLSAGTAGAFHEVRYFTSFSTSVGDYLTIGSSVVRITHDTGISMEDTGWIDLVAGAKIDNAFLALVMDDGNGADDPIIEQVMLYFK